MRRLRAWVQQPPLLVLIFFLQNVDAKTQMAKIEQPTHDTNTWRGRHPEKVKGVGSTLTPIGFGFLPFYLSFYLFLFFLFKIFFIKT